MVYQHLSIKQNAGFSLIELMIGLALSVVILGGIIAMYIPTLKTYKVAASHATVQDIEQLAQDVLGRKIRQASLLVCGKPNSAGQITQGVTAPNIANNLAPWIFNFATPFQAFSATDTAKINTTFVDITQNRLRQNGNTANNNNAGTAVGDIFYALTPDGSFARMTGINNDNPTRIINIQNSPDFKAGELFLIHDCGLPAVFRARAGSNATTLNFISSAVPDNDFGTQNGRQPIVSRFESVAFYLGALNRPNSAQPQPTLYQRHIQRPLSGNQLVAIDTPIISGVVNMRIEYGIDTLNPTNPNISIQYLTMAALAAQSPAIQSSSPLTARVSLMIEADRSSGENLQNTLLFPDITGQLVNCATLSGNPTFNQRTACPDFVVNNLKNTLHTVVQFTFNLSRQTTI